MHPNNSGPLRGKSAGPQTRTWPTRLRPALLPSLLALLLLGSPACGEEIWDVLFPEEADAQDDTGRGLGAALDTHGDTDTQAAQDPDAGTDTRSDVPRDVTTDTHSGDSEPADGVDVALPPPVHEPEWPADWARMEDEVLEESNRFRAQGASCGGAPFGPAPPLTMDPALRAAARGHSAEMGAQGFFSHDSPDGRTFMDRINAEAYSGRGPWAENIAAGYTSAAAVVQGWIDSPGHCRNLMNPALRELGAGYAFDATSPYRHYWTQVFGGGR